MILSINLRRLRLKGSELLQPNPHTDFPFSFSKAINQVYLDVVPLKHPLWASWSGVWDWEVGVSSGKTGVVTIGCGGRPLFFLS